MRRLNELKQLLVSQEMIIRSKSAENSKAKDALQNSKSKFKDGNDSFEKLERGIESLVKTRNQVAGEVDGAKEHAEHTLTLLAEAQKRFRRREEVRMKMKEKACQVGFVLIFGLTLNA